MRARDGATNSETHLRVFHFPSFSLTFVLYYNYIHFYLDAFEDSTKLWCLPSKDLDQTALAIPGVHIQSGYSIT